MLNRDPAPDFSDPIGMLRACHGRIEHFSGLALRLADQPLTADPPQPVREAAGQVLRYFDQAGPLHHADEERDLLPRLRPRLGAEPETELAALVANLEDEHAALNAHWDRLRPLLVELQAGRGVDPAAYRQAAEAFQDGQVDHLQRENAHLLPAAAALLSGAELEALGAAMARRRQVGQNNSR